MRYLTRYNPARDMVTWNRMMDRFFEDAFRGFGNLATQNDDGWQALALDISETDDMLQVEASLPGINPDDVDISIHDGVLTIKAETKREDEEQEDGGKFYLHERRYSAFQRAVRLPVDVNADEADATFENGVLTLSLPKAEEAKPKRITVKHS